MTPLELKKLAIQHYIEISSAVVREQREAQFVFNTTGYTFILDRINSTRNLLENHQDEFINFLESLIRKDENAS